MSPFNIAGTASTNTPLTVGDVIGQLPPELVRAGALPPEQPLSLPPALLENALRGGQPALPVFELYRVCPALFQTPVSPQDPRMVALPPAKLPALIAKAREAQGQGNGGGMPQGTSAAFASQVSPFSAGVPASPFAAAPPAAGPGTASPFSVGPASASPFSAAPASAPAVPSPFGMGGPQAGGAAVGSPFQMAQPGTGPSATGASLSMSPFGTAAAAFNGSAQANGHAHGQVNGHTNGQAAAQPAALSPFSLGRGAEAPAGKAAPGLFSMATESPPAGAAPSPFGMPPAAQQSGSITSLFTPKSQDSASSPATGPASGPAAAAPSPFGMPGAGASLLGGTPFGSPPAAVPAGGSPFASLQSGATAASAPAPAASATPQQASPFGAQPAAGALGGAASPFGSATGGSPFGAAPATTPAAGGSFFGAAATPALAGGGSPFGAAAPTPAPPPAPAGGTSPFSSGSASMAGASPIAGQLQPQAQAAAPAPTAFGAQEPASFSAPQAAAPAAASAFGGMQAFGSPPPAAASGGPAMGSGSGSGQAKLGFAAALHGFSADDLGFNPAMVPAWITSQLPASTLKEQISNGAVMVELGMLIDGISDLGFRNTLSAAKRSLQIKLPQNEVFHALSGASPSATPSAPLGAFATPKPALQPAAGAGAPQGGPGAFVIQPGAPAGQVNRVEPGAQAAMPAAAATPSFFTGGPSADAASSGVSAFPFGSGARPGGEPNSFAQAAGAAPAEESSSFGRPASRPLFSNGGQSAPPAPAPVQQPAIQSAFGSPPATPSPTGASAAFSFPQAPAASPVSMPQQPQTPPSGIFKPLGGAAVSAFGSPPSAAAPATSSLGMANKPFDPFAAPPSHTGALPGGAAPARSGSPEAGFSSAQLLGQSSGLPSTVAHLPAFSTPPVLQPRPAEASASAPMAGIASAFGSPFGAPPAAAAQEKATQPAFGPASFAPAIEARPAPASIPLFSEPMPATQQPSSRPLFGEAKPAAPGAPAAAVGASSSFAFAPAAAPSVTSGLAQASASFFGGGSAAAGSSAATKAASASTGKHSFLGLAPLDTQTDQLLLRALLGTEENLSTQRVVELLAAHPGLSACVCLQGSQVLSHADRSRPDAADFQRQAPDIARQLRSLAPLIGIDGAETFTLNAGGRLITFCFPGTTTVGVLHDEDPSTGLRDKITLIARELARMLG